MARDTTVRYSCDGCGKEMAGKDLRTFTLAESKTYDSVVLVSGQADLCVGCEADLHKTLKRLWPAKTYEKFEGLVRP